MLRRYICLYFICGWYECLLVHIYNLCLLMGVPVCTRMGMSEVNWWNLPFLSQCFSMAYNKPNRLCYLSESSSCLLVSVLSALGSLAHATIPGFLYITLELKFRSYSFCSLQPQIILKRENVCVVFLRLCLLCSIMEKAISSLPDSRIPESSQLPSPA